MTINPRYPSLGHYMGDSTPSAAEIETTRLLAVGALVGKMEEVCSSGVLTEADETDARLILAKTYKAYGFDSPAERSAPQQMNRS